MLISAEASPLELFENVLTQQEARERPALLQQRRDVLVDDNRGFSKVEGVGGGGVEELGALSNAMRT